MSFFFYVIHMRVGCSHKKQIINFKIAKFTWKEFQMNLTSNGIVEPILKRENTSLILFIFFSLITEYIQEQ